MQYNASHRGPYPFRHILRKYGYPPDLEDAAIRTVVLQAEALAAEVR